MDQEPAAQYRDCIVCGDPVIPEKLGDTCFECLLAKRDPEAARKRAEYIERKKSMKEMEMPPDAHWFQVVISGNTFGYKWRYYSVQLLGLQVRYSPEKDGAPYWRLYVGSGKGPGINIQLWQQRIRYKDSQVFGEVRYHPDKGFSYSVKGALVDATDREIILAKRGIDLLAKASRLSSSGRPINSSFVTDENKHEALQTVIDIGVRLYRNNGKVSQSDIAKELDGLYGITDKRSLYRLITERCGKSWKAEILPCIKSS